MKIFFSNSIPSFLIQFPFFFNSVYLEDSSWMVTAGTWARCGSRWRHKSPTSCPNCTDAAPGDPATSCDTRTPRRIPNNAPASCNSPWRSRWLSSRSRCYLRPRVRPRCPGHRHRLEDARLCGDYCSSLQIHFHKLHFLRQSFSIRSCKTIIKIVSIFIEINTICSFMYPKIIYIIIKISSV